MNLLIRLGIFTLWALVCLTAEFGLLGVKAFFMHMDIPHWNSPFICLNLLHSFGIKYWWTWFFFSLSLNILWHCKVWKRSRSFNFQAVNLWPEKLPQSSNGLCSLISGLHFIFMVSEGPIKTGWSECWIKYEELYPHSRVFGYHKSCWNE